jgi:hypothetical protein
MVLMTVSISILIAASVSILWQSTKQQLTMSSTALAMTFDLRMWIGMLLGGFILVYLLNLGIVLYFSSGYHELKVKSKETSQSVQ